MLYYNKSLARNSMSTYAVFYTSIEQLSWTNLFLGPLLLQFNVLSCILIVEFKLGRYLERTFKLLFKTIKVNGFKVKFERRAARNQSASLILTVLNILLPFIPFSHWFQALTLTSRRRNFLSAWLLKTYGKRGSYKSIYFFLLFRENFLLRKGVIVMHLIF